MLRARCSKREPDTGRTLTRRDESAPTRGPTLLAGTIGFRSSLLCSSGSGRIVGGSGKAAEVPAAGCTGCVKAKARERCREAFPIWLRRGFGEGTEARDASAPATAAALMAGKV